MRMMRGKDRALVGATPGADTKGFDADSTVIVNGPGEIASRALMEDSGLFDRAWYLATYKDVAHHGIDPLDHYINHGWREGRSPGVIFDTQWYLHQYKDIAASSIEPLTHYLIHGQVEGRVPNAFFDAEWYESTIQRSPDEKSLAPYAIYLKRGLAEGHAPLPELQHIFWCRHPTQDGYDQYKRLIVAIRPWWEQFGRGKVGILAALFSPYEEMPAMRVAGNDGVEKFIAFLEYAWTQNLDPGPLFQGEHYKRIMWRRGLSLQSGETFLQHYLRVGFDSRIVPTACFDEAVYYQQYLDINPTNCWAFDHFIRWGVFEGRRASRAPLPMVAQLAAHVDERSARINNWKYFLSTCGSSLNLDGAFKGMAHHAKVLEDIFALPFSGRQCSERSRSIHLSAIQRTSVTCLYRRFTMLGISLAGRYVKACRNITTIPLFAYLGFAPEVRILLLARSVRPSDWRGKRSPSSLCARINPISIDQNGCLRASMSSMRPASSRASNSSMRNCCYTA